MLHKAKPANHHGSVDLRWPVTAGSSALTPSLRFTALIALHSIVITPEAFLFMQQLCEP